MNMKGSYLIVSIVVCSILLACAATRSKSTGSMADGELITLQTLKDISAIEWNLTRMTKDNEKFALVQDSKTTFACDENGKVTGKATLNRYSGNLEIQDDGAIVWSKAFIMTRMAGPPELMQQETDFTQALMQTSRIYLKDSKLVLMSEDRSTVLEFEQTK
jgi:heat shock protein HslJ